MKRLSIRWQLVIYDLLIMIAVNTILLYFYRGVEALSFYSYVIHCAWIVICVLSLRIFFKVYQQIWRYGGIQSYVRLLYVDTLAFFVGMIFDLIGPRVIPSLQGISFARLLAVYCVNLLGCLAIRMFYHYAYKYGNEETAYGRFLNKLLLLFAGPKVLNEGKDTTNKIKIAIIGAGRTGVALAEELISNNSASYIPRCFVDVNEEKAGREIHGIPVFLENENTIEHLSKLEIQEVVFAIPQDVNKKELYEKYRNAGYKVKIYDYPVMQSAGKKRTLREFDIEEVLFRKPIVISNEKTKNYYKDKVILLTGGGGSIGSELCRQLAKMDPKKIIILDIYENGAYDVQQELRIAYGNKVNIQIEICSITNKKGLRRVFEKYHPQILINAAAHKHVPLMENNVIEAIQNNIFGTKNLIELCEEYKVERFMMVSTDKAVNPTNVMGATKRMCEMLVQCASQHGKTVYSATRFGNVLGSAGSVIPLFRKQIANGGPITITDKRIVRYFMTIPEASQLVLESGAMAQNGELFVLDMGQPIKIIDLANTMIRLSGVSGIEVVETGLRPGEKLYEELLVKTEKFTKTENELIYIEKDEAHSIEHLGVCLKELEEVCEKETDKEAKEVLKNSVPTFKTPEEINEKADEAQEMNFE